MSSKHSSKQTFEARRSAGSSHRQIHQVPLPFTTLIGREHEVQQVCTLLMNPDVRLLTVTGPGGIGKTRLALQVALDVQHTFPNG
ncbi:MAG: ATP-binding protein, partial [Chloroflexi bacterium]